MKHDNCQSFIHANKQRWGVNNTREFSVVDCNCDKRFYECLKNVSHLNNVLKCVKQVMVCLYARVFYALRYWRTCVLCVTGCLCHLRTRVPYMLCVFCVYVLVILRVLRAQHWHALVLTSLFSRFPQRCANEGGYVLEFPIFL